LIGKKGTEIKKVS